MAETTEPRHSETRMQPSTQSSRPSESYEEWLIEQLGLLAISKGQPQTPERLAINAADLADIPQETMRDVFARARREKTFGYPQVSDLREMAGLGGSGESLAAWEWVEQFMRRHVHRSGAEGYAITDGTGPIDWTSGKPRCQRIPVPEIPPEIERAVRLCGGWTRLKEMSDDEYPFVKKEFLAAVESYDRTEMASNRLLNATVASMAKQLAGAKRMLPTRTDEEADVQAEIATKESGAGPMPEMLPRTAGQDMTDEQFEARRRELQEQARGIQERYKTQEAI